MKMKELLSDESKWTKGNYALDEKDFPVASNSSNAVKFCLLGALHRCYPAYGSHIGIIQKIKEKIGNAIAHWNDDPKRTFPEVKTLLEELDI